MLFGSGRVSWVGFVLVGGMASVVVILKTVGHNGLAAGRRDCVWDGSERAIFDETKCARHALEGFSLTPPPPLIPMSGPSRCYRTGHWPMTPCCREAAAQSIFFAFSRMPDIGKMRGELAKRKISF